MISDTRDFAYFISFAKESGSVSVLRCGSASTSVLRARSTMLPVLMSRRFSYQGINDDALTDWLIVSVASLCSCLDVTLGLINDIRTSCFD